MPFTVIHIAKEKIGKCYEELSRCLFGQGIQEIQVVKKCEEM